MQRARLNLSGNICMLTYRKPIDCRQFNAKQYIKSALKEKEQQQLDFSGPQGNIYSNVMTLNVMVFLVKTVPPKNNIYSLHLSKCDLNDDMIKILVTGHWQKLSQLHLFGNNLTVLSLHHFKKAKWNKMQELQLGRNPMNNLTGASMVQSLPKSIEKLELSELQINADFMAGIVRNQWLQLKKLDLDKNSLQNSGLLYLVKSDWPHLQVLGLQCNFITNDGCKYLRTGVWRSLKRLYLNGNLLDHRGIEILSQNQWKLLQELNLRSKRFLTNQINFDVQRHVYTAVTVALLRFDNSDLTVHHLYPSYYENDCSALDKMVVQKGGLKIV